MAEFLAGKAALDDSQGFEGAAETVLKRNAEAAELLGRGADPNSEIDTAARDVVEHRDVLGDPQRVVQRQ